MCGYCVIYDEPKHHVVFKNEFTNIIDFQIKGGEETLMHEHLFANIPVCLSRIDFESRARGTVTAMSAGYGEADFSLPLIHSVKNVSSEPARVLDIEILPLRDGDIRTLGPSFENQAVEIENDMVRITRVKLNPRSYINKFELRTPRVRVALSAMALEIKDLDLATARVSNIAAGGYDVIPAGGWCSITNMSSNVIEFLEIEWKR